MKKEPRPADPLAAAVDELGRLESELLPHKAKFARVEALRKLLRNTCQLPEDQESNLLGGAYIVHLGPRANERTVDCLKLVKLIGARAFVALANVTLAKLEASDVAPEVIAQVVDTAQTGARPLTVFKQAATLPKRAA